jgi:hypothetical protein
MSKAVRRFHEDMGALGDNIILYTGNDVLATRAAEECGHVDVFFISVHPHR